MGFHDDNPMGSIFDTDEEPSPFGEPLGETYVPTPHDPMHSALRSGISWEGPGATAKRPEHVLDSPRSQFAPALPPSEEFFCCRVGPCRHYSEWHSEQDSAGDHVLTAISSVCHAFHELVPLNEDTRFACTRYAPPWWSLRGLRRRIISAHRIGKAQRRQAGRTRLTLVEQALEAIYSAVKGDAPELPRDPK